jgi:hypothetical protein
LFHSLVNFYFHGVFIIAERLDLDIIQAFIETIEFLTFFFVKLRGNNRLNDFDLVLQAIIARSKFQLTKGSYPGHSHPGYSPKYWEGALSVSTWMNSKWEMNKEYERFVSYDFLKILREKRDYFMMYISSDAISDPRVTIKRFFPSFEIDWDSDWNRRREEAGPILLSKKLVEVLKILRDEEE